MGSGRKSPFSFFANSIRDPHDPRKEEDAYTGADRCEEQRIGMGQLHGFETWADPTVTEWDNVKGPNLGGIPSFVASGFYPE